MSSYTLHVTIADIQPPIWRQIRVPGELSLGQLHEVIQLAFLWSNSHQHEFQVRKRRYGVPDTNDDSDLADEEALSVAKALPSKSSKILYTYDLGDDWTHNITVDSIDQESPRGHMAPVACLAGARAAPPEDCGGPDGYVEFLEAIRSPEHPRHDELLQWIGGEFDPEWFELDDVNPELSALG